MRIPISKLYFPKEYEAIKELFEFRKIKPMTDIWIFHRYPRGWDCEVGVGKETVMIILFDTEEQVFEIEYYQCLGFRKNGTLIYDLTKGRSEIC